MPNLRGWEWLILVALILLLFGAKRLPDAARGLGRSLRIFKAETKGLTDDSQPAAPQLGQGAEQTSAEQTGTGQASTAPSTAPSAAAEGAGNQPNPPTAQQ